MQKKSLQARQRISQKSKKIETLVEIENRLHQETNKLYLPPEGDGIFENEFDIAVTCPPNSASGSPRRHSSMPATPVFPAVSKIRNVQIFHK